MQLILPPGTRVTAVAEVRIAETGATLPAGAVGVIVRSPGDATAAVARFLDLIKAARPPGRARAGSPTSSTVTRTSSPPPMGGCPETVANDPSPASTPPCLARGADHQRWPNAFFRQAGLFTMYEAYRLLIQASLSNTNRRAGCGRSARQVGREGSLNRLSLPL